MKKRKPYTLSEARLTADIKRADWDIRLRVWMLKNQGLSFNEIGRMLGKSPQGVQIMYSKIKDMPIEEIETIRKSLEYIAH